MVLIYKYYNQNNYANIPYPSSANPKASVKSGGCGVCCGAMIVSSMTDNIVDPKFMATYAITKKARVSGGTDFNILAKNICIDYGLTYETTSDENKLLKHLQSGGMAVANVGGDRSGYTGVFSSEGHFIVVANCNGNTLTILDPGYYSGKFNKAGRKRKVTIDKNNYCYCNISVLDKDTENRSPAYWLFSKESEDEDLVRYKKLSDIPNGLQAPIEALMNAGIISGDGSDPTGNNDVIDLSHDQVRTLVFAYRGGAFDKKLKAVGLKTVVG